MKHLIWSLLWLICALLSLVIVFIEARDWIRWRNEWVLVENLEYHKGDRTYIPPGYFMFSSQGPKAQRKNVPHLLKWREQIAQLDRAGKLPD